MHKLYRADDDIMEIDRSAIDRKRIFRRVMLILLGAPIALFLVASTAYSLLCLLFHQRPAQEVFGSTIPYILLVVEGYTFLTIHNFLRKDGQTLSDIGLTKQGLLLESVVGLITGVAVYPLSVMFNRFLWILVPVSIGSSAIYGSKSLWVVIFFVCGFFEECIWRGYAFMKLRNLIGTWKSLLISSLLFGLFHWGLGLITILWASFIGAFLTLLYIWRKKLASNIIAHITLNLLLFFGPLF